MPTSVFTDFRITYQKPENVLFSLVKKRHPRFQCFLIHFFDIYHFSSKSPNLIDIFHFDQICPPQAPKNCIFPFANEISNVFLMISTTFLETFGKCSSKMVYQCNSTEIYPPPSFFGTLSRGGYISVVLKLGTLFGQFSKWRNKSQKPVDDAKSDNFDQHERVWFIFVTFWESNQKCPWKSEVSW